MTTRRDEENFLPSIVRYSDDTTSVGRLSAPSEPGFGHAAEIAMCVDQCSMDEVAPRGNQLVIVPADELGPGEVGVLVLGAGDHQVVAQGVRVVAIEHVADVDHVTTAGGELLALHVQELAGHDVVRQLQAAGAEEDRRPQHGVERDVVLPHHVVVPGVRVLPPVLPRVRLSAVGGPLDRGRQISDHGVEPDVDLLVRVVLPAGQRDGHAPVKVARDRARLEVAYELQ